MRIISWRQDRSGKCKNPSVVVMANKKTRATLAVSECDDSDSEPEMPPRKVVKKATSKGKSSRSATNVHKITMAGRNATETPPSPSRGTTSVDPSSSEGPVSLSEQDISLIVAEVLKSLRAADRREEEDIPPPGE